jgi:hypothetical protein
LSIHSSYRRSLIPIAAILVLGCALRTIQYLGRGSFWFDELSLTLTIQQRSLADLVSQPLDYRQVAPAGFVAAVKAGSALFGINELALRLFPWVAGCAAVFLFWRVSLRVLSGSALLAALILFAVSPSLIWYSGNLKPYSGDVAATLLLVLFALRFRERPDDRRQAIVAGLAGGITLFFSFPAVMTAGVVGLILFWWWVRERPHASVAPVLWLTISWTAAAVMTGVLALKLTDPETNAYMRRFWSDGFVPAPWNGVMALRWIPDRLVDCLGFLLLFIAAEWTIGRILVAASAVLACVGLIVLWRRSSWTAALIAAPAAAAIIGSSVRLLPFQGRVSLYAGWPLLLLAMAGLEAIHSWLPGRARVVSVTLTLLIAGIPTVLVLWYRPPYRTQETRLVLAALASRWQSGDRLYVYYSAQKAMEFYGRRLGFTDWISGPCHREEPRAYFREIDQFRGSPRVWFFYTHSAAGYGEPEIIRSYLRTIGEERDRIPDPFDARGQAEAAAYLYDLSDRKHLGATTWKSHRYPQPKTRAPRVRCDGTRVGAD